MRPQTFEQPGGRRSLCANPQKYFHNSSNPEQTHQHYINDTLTRLNNTCKHARANELYRKKWDHGRHVLPYLKTLVSPGEPGNQPIEKTIRPSPGYFSTSEFPWSLNEDLGATNQVSKHKQPGQRLAVFISSSHKVSCMHIDLTISRPEASHICDSPQDQSQKSHAGA